MIPKFDIYNKHMHSYHSNGRVFLGYDKDKLLKTYPAISIFVSVLNHLFYFNRGKSFPNAFTNFGKLLNAERTHSVFVENFKQLF